MMLKIKRKFKALKNLIQRKEIFEALSRLCESFIPGSIFFLKKSSFLELNECGFEATRRHQNVAFQKAEKKDIQDILVCSSQADDECMRKLYEDFLDAGCDCITINCNNEIVGYAWIFFDSYILTYDNYRKINIEITYDEQSAFIGNGYIHPAHRLKGLFPILIRTIVKRLDEEYGIKRIVGNIDTSNEHSMKSHIRFGFKTIKDIYYISLFGLQLIKIRDIKNGSQEYKLWKNAQIAI